MPLAAKQSPTSSYAILARPTRTFELFVFPHRPFPLAPRFHVHGWLECRKKRIEWFAWVAVATIGRFSRKVRALLSNSLLLSKRCNCSTPSICCPLWIGSRDCHTHGVRFE